jgi:cell wall-associated NlpC family hydrolase
MSDQSSVLQHPASQHPSWQPSRAILLDAFAHAATCAPMESCGLVIEGRYYAVTNEADEIDYFTMSARERVALEAKHGPAEAIVHSHCYRNNVASLADLASCEKFGVPWLIVAWPLSTWRVIEPTGFQVPLLGRPWAWGTLDCFGLVRDAYRQLAAIELPDFERDWGWWEKGGDLIAAHFVDAGFEALAPGAAFENLDVIGCQIRASVVNHVGLWLPGDLILHQLAGRVSTKEAFGGVFHDTMVLHLRHSEIGGRTIGTVT